MKVARITMAKRRKRAANTTPARGVQASELAQAQAGVARNGAHGDGGEGTRPSLRRVFPFIFSSIRSVVCVGFSELVGMIVRGGGAVSNFFTSWRKKQ